MEDCGCKVGMFDIGIEFCPMHAAARELLEACKGLLNSFGCEMECDCGRVGPCSICTALEAVAKAEGREP